METDFAPNRSGGYLNCLRKMAHCLTFTPFYQPRVWGGRKLSEAFGRPLPANTPIGESSELVHRPGEQSVVYRGPFHGRTLHQLWSEQRRKRSSTWFLCDTFSVL